MWVESNDGLGTVTTEITVEFKKKKKKNSNKNLNRYERCRETEVSRKLLCGHLFFF